MDNIPKAWYTKNLNMIEPCGFIHAATQDGKFTLCGKKLNSRWWFDIDKHELYEIDCPKCLRTMRKKYISK